MSLSQSRKAPKENSKATRDEKSVIDAVPPPATVELLDPNPESAVPLLATFPFNVDSTCCARKK
jgi:hypothetical protein